jgi:putative DNA primase/helicase
MTEPVEKIIAALRAAGCEPKRSGNGYTSRCPAHDDRTPSLSIGAGADGRALVRPIHGSPLTPLYAGV